MAGSRRAGRSIWLGIGCACGGVAGAAGRFGAETSLWAFPACAALLGVFACVAVRLARRSQAGARVQAREDFADLLLRSSVDCVTVLDRQGRLIFMNEAGLRLTEVDDFRDIEGTALTDVLPIETRDLVEAAIERGRRGEPSQITAFCPTAKGTPRWW